MIVLFSEKIQVIKLKPFNPAPYFQSNAYTSSHRTGFDCFPALGTRYLHHFDGE